jgi:hypothetical protein
MAAVSFWHGDQIAFVLSGTADLTVYTTGANSRQIDLPNVLGIGRKQALIHTMLQEIEVTRSG